MIQKICQFAIILLPGLLLAAADDCGISTEERTHSVTLKVKGYNLEGTDGATLWRTKQNVFMSTLNSIVNGNQSNYEVTPTISYVEDSGTSDLNVVVYAKIASVGYLPPGQLSTACSQNYYTMVRIADVYYYPDQVTIGVTANCDPDTTESTKDDAFDWEFTAIVIAVSGFFILISIIIFVSVKSSRRRQKSANLQSAQINKLEQTITHSAGLQQKHAAPMMDFVVPAIIPTAFVVDDLDPQAQQDDFHETTLHTKL